ncbi:YcjF family protein [Shewanella sp. A3A]|nr:YcjF family protein [Shewanella ferrihydritica]
MNLPPSDDKAARIQQRKLYNTNDVVQWQDSETTNHVFAEEVEQVAEQTLRPKRRSWLTRLAVFALLVGVVVQLILTLLEAWQRSSVLFITYAAIFAILLLWLLALVAKEWRYLRQLKGNIDGQQVAERLKVSVQMGEAPTFIGDIVARLPAEASSCVKQLNQSLSPNQNDAEQLRLFESIVLDDRDKAARRIVRKFALQSSLILAVSPFALLDMVLVLWRNQAMIREIAACYGIELGYWSRVRLIRGIFWNIVYAGTSELMTDFGSQMLSMEMTGKLSARLAQGLGGGLLTARLGLQAMRLCRPVKFNEQNQPSLTKIHMELLKELKQRMATSERAASEMESQPRK